MKISKEQQKELKKIDTSFIQIERLSIKNDLNLKTLFRDLFTFKVVKLNSGDRQKIYKQAKSRQEVFEHLKAETKKAKSVIAK